MNLHPIFVHFPIALMTVYAIFEIISFRSLRKNKAWFNIKLLLILVSVISAFIALQTGEMAENAVRGVISENIVEVHSFWAGFSTYTFGIIAIIYLIAFVFRIELFGKYDFYHNKLRNKFEFVNKIVENGILIKILAIIGLIAITITGALGGAMVYGPDVDPIVKWIYGLFF